MPTLEISDETYEKIRSQIEGEKIDSTGMKYVLVRTYSAGVHIGYLKSRDGKEVTLNNSRRIWSWEGAFTLSAIATNSLGKGSRLSVEVGEIVLTEAIEIITISSKRVIGDLRAFK